MKKIYKSPEMKVVKIRTAHLCNLSMVESTKANGSTTVLSRESDWWDDEED